MTAEDDAGALDPAVELMVRLKGDPQLADTPMYVTFPDGSTLSIAEEPNP